MIPPNIIRFLLLPVILLTTVNLRAKPDYRVLSDLVEGADFSARKAHAIPEVHRKIRVIIDTDAANEIDDLWAIALALASPDRLQIEGFVAANFDNEHGGPSSVEQSYELIQQLLAKAHLEGRYPVLRGGAPMRYKYEPSESPGVDFIIERAMASSPSDPLWIVGLGAATDLASAYLKEPRIADRVVFFWHGRTRWPDQCWNFNVFGDRLAATLLFRAPVTFILFDTGTYLTCPMEESAARLRPCGELGAFLHDFRKRNPWFMQSDKGFFDLGDIAALVDPSVATWETTDCPEVGPDLAYHFTGKKGRILRCSDIDRDKTFALFYARLKAAFPPSRLLRLTQRREAVHRGAYWRKTAQARSGRTFRAYQPGIRATVLPLNRQSTIARKQPDHFSASAPMSRALSTSRGERSVRR